ncbi:tripartite motif-containing protein 16-like protein isoform X3 [Rhinoraja longicauda]
MPQWPTFFFFVWFVCDRLALNVYGSTILKHTVTRRTGVSTLITEFCVCRGCARITRRSSLSSPLDFAHSAHFGGWSAFPSSTKRAETAGASRTSLLGQGTRGRTVSSALASNRKLIMQRKKELEGHLQITASEVGKWIQNIDCIKESTQRVKGNALAKFSELISAVQVAQREVLGFIERERQAELNRAERVRKELEQRWSELRQEKVRLEALSQIEDSIAISQEYLDFNDIAESPASPPLTTGLDAKLGKVERVVSGLSTLIKDHVQTAWTKNLENIGSADDEEPILSPSVSTVSNDEPQLPETQRREDLLQYCCQLTLDLSTVQKELFLSDGNQRVTNIYPRSEDYEPGPERFDLCSQVLCREPLGGGQFYWEVELNDGDAMIGITHGQIRRKGSDSCCILGRNLFSWCVEFWYNNVSAWHNNEETRLQVGRYGRIGVCLNCPGGTLTFYGVTEQVVIIHQFHAAFNEPMHPAFWVYCDTTLSICQCP